MSETGVKDGPSALEVASYLRRHPDFLGEFPDIALSLSVPRDQGATTSLASYQLEVLRDQNRELNRRLRELIETASDNEQLMLRVHAFTVALMRERSLGDSVRRVVAALTEDFPGAGARRSRPAEPDGAGTDDGVLVRLVLFRAASAELPATDWLILAPNGARDLPAFGEFLARGEPLCGRLQPDKLAALFGARADEVRSAALLPVDRIGMLAIGSHDAHRFHPGMGTVFLRLIAEAIAAAVARFD
jgi:uncharacterized protein YigA (DUF484 family)